MAKNGCIFKKTILHELGHIIGLQHEQSRKDRDESLVIVYKNVSPSEYHNFDKKLDVNDIRIPYDYCSIMQYRPRSFSKTGEIQGSCSESYCVTIDNSSRPVRYREATLRATTV